MCKKKIDLNDGTIFSLMQKEYEQICQDWRHGDSMLWQSLAVAIALTGLTFSIVFNNEMKLDWAEKSIIFFLAFLLNMVLLVKICKDRYYQLGSNELLLRMGGQQLIDTYEIPYKDNKKDNKYDLRMHEPSGDFFEDSESYKKIPLYREFVKVSTFRWFFIVQIILSAITFGYALYCFVRYFLN